MRLAAAAAAAAVLLGAAAQAMMPQPLAVLQGLDKITARVSRFDAPVGRPVAFGTLSITVRDCEKSAPEERPESAAFVEISETRPSEAAVRRFSGWMFSSSPALSALEHPVYDVTLLDCKAAGLSAAPPAASSGANPGGSSRGKAAR